jgi:hypothetical protein
MNITILDRICSVGLGIFFALIGYMAALVFLP